MAWSKGKPWRGVRSLDTLNRQIRAAYPRAVPPATPASSWGAIADDAHNSSSDHYPHYYAALGSTAVVCARDFPHAPALGLDAHALAERLRQSRDSRIAYIISNGRETGPRHGWEWDRYTGSDPHDTHIHVSTVHTAAADNVKDWQRIGPTAGEDDDMTPPQAQMLKDVHYALFTADDSGRPAASVTGRIAAIAAKVSNPATPVAVDASAVAAALAGNAAFVAAIAKAVNDDEARRMAS